uniref:Uncharacterized protein n=1 Tax=Arundo donax TaxID=35708 RepID=A0A0A9DCI5_ARUDO
MYSTSKRPRLASQHSRTYSGVPFMQILFNWNPAMPHLVATCTFSRGNFPSRTSLV